MSGFFLPSGQRPLPRPFPVDPFFRRLSGSQAFLRIIAENPNDDTSRLVFADWLEDAGRPERGEFIRAQCHLTRLAPWDARRADLAARARVLFDAHGGSWVDGLPRLEQVCWGQLGNFHRGLLEALDLEAQTFAQMNRALFDAIDLRRLRLAGCTGTHMQRLVGLPGLERVTALNLEDTWLGLADVQTLAQLPALTRLRELNLSTCWIGDGGVRELAASPYLGRLRSLHLALNGIRASGAEVLAASPSLTGLVALDLSGNWIRDTGVAALARSANLTTLACLILTDTRVQRLGAAMLASSPHLSRLAVLDLAGNDIRVEGARALAGTRHLRGLVALNLSDARLGSEGALALARSPQLNLLAALDLRLNGIDESAAAEVRARWPFALL